MTEIEETTSKRKIWIRGFFMLLMAMVYQLAGTVMFIVTVIQFVMALLDTPNNRLIAFGRGLGRYLQQIVNFLTFAEEEIPFPFSDWPAGE
ncbi:MAG: DUF4389 domain-containing protein [Gallionellaceae bacterium]|jgi:hypothetical protein